MSDFFKHTIKTSLAFVSALLVIGLGLVVLVGWLSHSSALIQVNPAFVPMQFNTALGFLFGGIGLLFTLRGYPRVTQFMGALLVLLGSATLIEYLFGIGFGIDELFIKHYIQVQTSHPGRMAPNTALCFLLSGIVLLFGVRSFGFFRSQALGGTLAATVLGLGSVALTGYLSGIETAYGWGAFTRMAIHTSSGFMVLGAGLLFSCWRMEEKIVDDLPLWFPLPFGIMGLTITLSLWQALVAKTHLDLTGAMVDENYTDEAVFVAGILFTVILMITIRLTQISREKMRIAIESNERYQKELEHRQLIEKKLIQAKEEAEAANQAKTNFLSTMSHELRTPLNGMIGMTQMVLETELSDEQRNTLDIVINSSKTLLGIIGEVLDLSKIESGKLTIEEIEIDLYPFLDDINDLFRLSAENKNIHYIVEPFDRMPLWVKTDPTHLKAILSNLLANAVKFTFGGQILFRVKIITQDQSQVRVRFEIEDTGIGITEEQQRIIFDSFTQADSSTSRRFGGTGLGLNIAQKLTSAMEGRIGLKSEIGKGSLFWVEMKFGLARSQRLKKKEVHAAPQNNNQTEKNGKVLVVEDEPINQLVIDKMLRNLGLEPEIAANGRIAIDLLRSTKYSLILMDCIMPEMDGFETTKQIRSHEKNHNLKTTPIVALSAMAMKGDKERCLEAGMNDYLPKPIFIEDLSQMLGKYLHISASN